ncbi:hypothetical protein OH77DRAFT_1421624 [Trametes cingulata]|nr:hypothetical protein OH77DRAFT_1421624 [Trametes cingulata]
MSFNARLPSQSSATHRGRPSYRNSRPPARGAAVKTEDAQPNELLNKRNVSGPPVIRTSAPLPRTRGRGAPPSSNGRRQVPQQAGPYAPAPDAASNDNWSQRANLPPARARDEPPGLRPHTKPQPRVNYARDLHTQPASPPGSRSPNVHSKHARYDSSLAPPRTERWSAPGPSRDAQRSFAAPSMYSRESALSDRYLSTADDLPASSPVLDELRPPAIGAASRTIPPLPKTQPLPSKTRDLPPHMGAARIRSTPSVASRMPSPRSHSPASDRPSSLPTPKNSCMSSYDTASGSSTQVPLKAGDPSRASSASASDLLLSDLTQGIPAGTRAALSRRDAPPLKRRRISPPGPSSNSLSAPPPGPEPLLATATSRDAARTMSPRSPVIQPRPTEMAAASPIVKRERSPSPMIDDASAPRLVTEGCVRIAPLPPECRTTRPGYKAARQAWTGREVKKLRELGLQPTRVFVREDGMVIDWKSNIPVMSDTLRPPPPDTSQVEPTGTGVEPARPAKKAKRTDASTSQITSTTEVEDARTVDYGEAHALSPQSDQPGAATERVIPTPGQTIWKRILPPPRPRPLNNRNAGRSLPTTSNPAPVQLPPVVVQPSTPSIAADETASVTSVHPDVEIIDLTKDEDDNGTAYREERHEARPPLAPPPPDVVMPSAPASSTPKAVPHPRRPTLSQPAPPAIISSQSVQVPGRDRGSTPSGAAAYAPEVEVTVNLDELQAAAVEFLQRYLRAFLQDRSTLASAYSRAASFSVQTLPSPSHDSSPASTRAVPPPPTYHSGRIEIIAALLDLPDNETLCAVPDANGVQPMVQWDFLHAKEAGDTLLICYATANAAGRAESSGKGKARAVEGSSWSGHAACEQRFILRPKEWDEEDRSTPGLWPLVAVAHQMLFRSLPP